MNCRSGVVSFSGLSYKKLMRNSPVDIIFVHETGSTNNYATRLLREKEVTEGTLVLTFRQTHGRGQASNSWESRDDLNLTFSLVLRPHFLPASSQFLISQAVSLGLVHYLDSLVQGVTIKWPNDILVHDRKLAGILIEHAVMGNRIAWSVAGIGLNVNQTDYGEYVPRAVSLKMLTGREYDLHDVLDGLAASILTWYERLRTDSQEKIVQEYYRRLFRMGQWWKYRADGQDFEARITGTDPYGRLLLEKRNGETGAWPFKGVQMIWD